MIVGTMIGTKEPLVVTVTTINRWGAPAAVYCAFVTTVNNHTVKLIHGWDKLIVRVKISTSLRSEDFIHCHGYSNKNLVKVVDYLLVSVLSFTDQSTDPPT